LESQSQYELRGVPRKEMKVLDACGRGIREGDKSPFDRKEQNARALKGIRTRRQTTQRLS